MPSPFGVDPNREKKIGHRRVDASGETSYKKVPPLFYFKAWFFISTSTWILLFLYSTSRRPPLLWKGPSSWGSDTLLETSAPNLREMFSCRIFMWLKAFSSQGDVKIRCTIRCKTFMFLFSCGNTLYSEGSNLTPAHHYPDFRFKTYAPVAFRYFRELFGIRPDDYLVRNYILF